MREKNKLKSKKGGNKGSFGLIRAATYNYSTNQ